MNYIVETRNEFTIQLINILSPLLYEGFESIFKDTLKVMAKDEPNLLKTFQQLIKKIPSWNSNIIEMETQRIISQSRCDWLHDLLKAVIKSNILMLSTNNINDSNFKIKDDFLNINFNNFVHKCYIECARQFYTMPYLFSTNFRAIERKKYQKECMLIIDLSIREAIRKFLPVNYILKKYLDYEKSEVNSESLSQSEKISKNLPSKINSFINPEVVNNFEESDNSDSDNCDDKETINLLNDIKEKLNTGNLLKSINNDVITNPVNSDKHIYNIANNPSVSDGFLPNPSYNDISLKEDEVSKVIAGGSKLSSSSEKKSYIKERVSEKSVEIEKSIISENQKTKFIEDTENSLNLEDNNIDTQNSISYKVEHDSEYEAVFSNVNDFNDKKTKKKKKDEYFSKFNNI